MDHVNSWKNKEVFESQLKLNEGELGADMYPDHWAHFLQGIQMISDSFLQSYRRLPKNVLDLGCGCGAYSELLRRHHQELEYQGVDYAQEAIDVAKDRWGYDCWEVRGYEDINENDTEEYDILHAGAMLDILPNGDEAFAYLVGLGFKAIIFGRMKMIQDPSRYDTYEAYDKIKTYAFYHNIENLVSIAREQDYAIHFMGDSNSCTMLLIKNQ